MTPTTSERKRAWTSALTRLQRSIRALQEEEDQRTLKRHKEMIRGEHREKRFLLQLSKDVPGFCRALGEYMSCKGIAKLAQTCKSIRAQVLADVVALDLTCPTVRHKVDDMSLRWISLSFRRLQCLNIAGCAHVTSTGVLDLAAECRQLRSLDLTNCRKCGDIASTKLLGGWLCFSCTLMNKTASSLCEACGTPRTAGNRVSSSGGRGGRGDGGEGRSGVGATTKKSKPSEKLALLCPGLEVIRRVPRSRPTVRGIKSEA